jgi:hypothetical protein
MIKTTVMAPLKKNQKSALEGSLALLKQLNRKFPYDSFLGISPREMKYISTCI